MPPQGDQPPFIPPEMTPSSNQLPQMHTSIPPAQPPEPERHDGLKVLAKNTAILLTVLIVIYGAFIGYLMVSSSNGESATEIIYISSGPFILLAIFMLAVIKFIIASIRLRHLNQLEPGKKKHLLASWLALGGLSIYGLFYAYSYFSLKNSVEPEVNNKKAFQYIEDCKITGIHKDGLGDGETVVLDLDPDLPEATDAYGGINYFRSKQSEWDKLVTAVKAAESKCGDIEIDDTTY